MAGEQTASTGEVTQEKDKAVVDVPATVERALPDVHTGTLKVEREEDVITIPKEEWENVKKGLEDIRQQLGGLGNVMQLLNPLAEAIKDVTQEEHAPEISKKVSFLRRKLF